MMFQRVHLDIQVGEHAIDYQVIQSKDKLSELQLRIRQLLDQVEQITKEQNYQRVSYHSQFIYTDISINKQKIPLHFYMYHPWQCYALFYVVFSFWIIINAVVLVLCVIQLLIEFFHTCAFCDSVKMVLHGRAYILTWPYLRYANVV
jgi:hypothetical protein